MPEPSPDKPAPEYVRAWIENRYGLVGLSNSGDWIHATVPVMGGTAHGRGKTEEQALEALYEDLTFPAKQV